MRRPYIRWCSSVMTAVVTSVLLLVLGTSLRAQVAPTIVTQPEPQTILSGLDFVLSVLANGTSPMRFQWRKNGVNISQPNNNVFSLSTVSPKDSGDYSVVVSNNSGSVTSRWVRVEVVPGPLHGWIVRQAFTNNSLPALFYSLNSVVYGGGMFVAVGNVSDSSGIAGLVLTSPDGVTWNTRRFPPPSGFSDVAYNAGRFIVASDSVENPGILVSTNAVDWTFLGYRAFSSLGGIYPVRQVVAGGDYVLAATTSSSFAPSPIYFSSDTENWSGTATPYPVMFTGAAYGNGTFVLAGYSTFGPNPLFVSSTSLSFTSVPLSSALPTDSRTEVIYAGDQFVASRTTSLGSPTLTTEIFVSPNGTNWTKTATLNDSLFGLGYGEGTFVLGGRFSIYSSINARNWHQEFAPPSNLELVSVASGNGSFVAVGRNLVMQSVGLGQPRVVVDITGEGAVTRSPNQTNYHVGDQVTLNAVPSRYYKFARWEDGSTSNPRTITVSSIDPQNLFRATFVPETPLETVYYGPVSRVAPVGTPSVLVDGRFVPSGTTSATNSARVTLLTTFPQGIILYTLNGTPPTFGSPVYTEPLELTSDATIRAIAFDAGFSRWSEADPVQLKVDPTVTYSLVTRSQGGGTISFSPARERYTSNTLVVLSAVPNPGWVFLKWRGSVTGTAAIQNIRMVSDRCVEAVFGTKLSTMVAGGGDLVREPSGEIYPYGATVRLSAVPEPGNAFGLWGNGAIGNVNPATLVITNAAPSVSSLFVPLKPEERSLNVLSKGSGTVFVNPRKNVFTKGQRVTLVAKPNPGEEFFGWTFNLTTNALQNPLELEMNESLSVTAAFSTRPVVDLAGCPDPRTSPSMNFQLSGEWNVRYRIEESSDLINWRELGRVTLNYGSGDIPLNKPDATNRFFRATRVP